MDQKVVKTTHLTSVHLRSDTRIFIKQCRSLAAQGYDVSLIVADGKGDEYKDKINIFDVGQLSGRLNRMFKTTQLILKRAAELDADIYHLHDPELIPIGLKLKRLGKKVIFDAHEDLPQQLLNKPYLGPISARLLSTITSMFEHYSCRRLDGIIAATPFIRDKFLKINPNTIDINNFPLIGELASAVPWAEKRAEVCYVGGIGAIRGIRELVHACEYLQSPARLNLVGSFYEPTVEAEVKSYAGWTRVNELGFKNRTGVRNVLMRSVAGLVTLHPVINYLDSLPVKMFEYMSAGIPVIASDFPLWREIIKGVGCGILVDPLNPEAIANAIRRVLENPEEAEEMGQRGRKAVEQIFNWDFESIKLINLYKGLLNSTG